MLCLIPYLKLGTDTIEEKVPESRCAQSFQFGVVNGDICICMGPHPYDWYPIVLLRSTYRRRA